MFSLKRQQGASFEHQARLFLESKGLKFIAANQNFKCGELDQKWLDAANLWLMKQNMSLEDADCRFDLIAFGKTPQDIQWIPNFLD